MQNPFLLGPRLRSIAIGETGLLGRGCCCSALSCPGKASGSPSPRGQKSRTGRRVQTPRVRAHGRSGTCVPSSFSPSMASWSPLRPLLVTEENCQLSTSESCAQRAQGGFRKKDRFWGEDSA